MIRKLALLVTATALGYLLLAPVALANPAPSRERAESSREQSLRRIHSLLDNQVARERLEKMGLDRQDLEKRLDRLDDEQLRQLSERLDSLSVGGDSVLTVLLILTIIAALVLLIIYLAERT
jgi:hypothetical protein